MIEFDQRLGGSCKFEPGGMGDRYGFTVPVFDCLISKMTEPLGRCSWRVALLGDREEGSPPRGEKGERVFSDREVVVRNAVDTIEG